MGEWIMQNQNPAHKNVDDCTIRAISVATGKSWERIYCELAVEGYAIKDMMHANKAWHKVLKNNGFTRHSLPERCPDCYTVRDFCNDHPHGVYVLSVPDHVVTAINGNWMDTWNSGFEPVLFYFCKE